MAKSIIQAQIEQIESKIHNEAELNFNEDKFQVQTRAKIGRTFVRGFFIGIFGSIIMVILYNIVMYYMTRDNTLFISLENIIPLLWSIIGTPLGFVMGYYFKTDKSEQSI